MWCSPDNRDVAAACGYGLAHGARVQASQWFEDGKMCSGLITEKMPETFHHTQQTVLSILKGSFWIPSQEIDNAIGV